MTATIVCLLILAAVLLFALYRKRNVRARLKLLGVDFSLEADDDGGSSGKVL